MLRHTPIKTRPYFFHLDQRPCFCHHQGMKVLAVENNPELLKLFSHLLEKEGFETVRALSGQDGLEKFREHRPDIACLDILLEGLSGIEVCRRIRAEDADIPILLITSKSNDADIKDGMAAGATEYIVKPYDLGNITTLMHKVARGCLARANPAALGDYFDFGDLRVFPARLTGERGDNSIDLNLREIGILKLFHAHKGKVVAHDSLAPLCWQSQETPTDRAIEWQIKQLRKKIEPDPANPGLIRNDGGGYLFG